ncbi:queuosine precursor transporter [Roseobacter sp. HKCCA0434]|uniref:queuosine precursor transporter n=1 Tax=Roseobacter sp. HKCCA0434 TaxID=3079297 RepID=UPI002905BA62|nr:queuosine precursor transporter [Roseobacter sp. HKCCA0434]
MSRGFLIGVASMAAVVVASNILVQYLLGDWLTWGAFTYPVAFLVTDLTNRLMGREAARRVVLTGFAVGVACSLIGSQIEGEFGPLVSLRVALGSGIAFLTAQLVDVVIFDRLRDRDWWRAPLASTLVGSTLDTALFFFIAFSGALVFLDPAQPNGWAREAVPLLGTGPMLPLWVSLAIADWGVKLGLAALALIPFRAISRHARA